jgi:predicted nucleic acid-binding protein
MAEEARVLVVDASVAVKCLVVEPGSDLAWTLLESALRRHDRLVAPDVVLLEVASVIRRAGRRGDLGPGEVQQAIQLLESLPVRVVTVRRLWRPALECALSTGASVYDAAYVALAAGLGVPLVTADAALVQVVAGTPYADIPVMLADWVASA